MKGTVGSRLGGPCFFGEATVNLRLLLGAAVLLASALILPPARAHGFELTDSRLILSEDAFRIEMVCDLDALALGVPLDEDSALLAERLRTMEPALFEETVAGLRDFFQRRVRFRIDGEPAAFTVSFPEYGTAAATEAEIPTVLGTRAALSGSIPSGAETFEFFVSRTFPPVHLRILGEDGAEGRTLILERGERSPDVAFAEAIQRPGFFAVFGQYVELGFLHILPKGLDHILFVLGLFLLSLRWRPLLWQVSAFTLAHTLTLALSMYGVVSLPARPVEALIALSIVYVAIENMTTRELKARRVAVVFAFGLLHGLGFAGVLTDLGLPETQYATALIAFNIGVELGQLAVLVLAFALLGWALCRDKARTYVVFGLSGLIALVGLFWFVERAFL